MEKILEVYEESVKGLFSKVKYIVFTNKKVVITNEVLAQGDVYQNIKEIKAISYDTINDFTMMLIRDKEKVSYQIRLKDGQKINLEIRTNELEKIEKILIEQGVVYYHNQNERQYGSAEQAHSTIVANTSVDIASIIQRSNNHEKEAVQLLAKETGWDINRCKEVISYEMNGKMLSRKATFIPTKTIGVFMAYDEKNHMVGFNSTMFNGFNTIYQAEEIVGYELIEDETVITKGGLGKAALGGLVFGSGGAVVGAVLGKKNTDYCTMLRIRVVVNDVNNPTIFINFINGRVKKDTVIYKQNFDWAYQCLSLLDLVTKTEKSEGTSVINVSNPISEADEILKFKKLMDEGIITKEEFEAKKKQILGV